MSKITIPPSGVPSTLEQANELIGKLLDRIAELEDRSNRTVATLPSRLHAMVLRLFRLFASGLLPARSAEPNPASFDSNSTMDRIFKRLII